MKEQKQPKPLKRPLTFPSNWWLVLYGVLMLFEMGSAFVMYPKLPDPLPVHYDRWGEPDRFVPKNEWDGLWFFVVITLVLAGIFVGCFLMSKYGTSEFYKSKFRLSKDEARILACRIILVSGVYVLAACSVITYLPFESVRHIMLTLVTVLLILMFLSIAIVILRSTVQVRKTHRFQTVPGGFQT